MRSIVVFGLILPVLISCGNEGKRLGTGLTENEYEFFRSINISLSETHAAINLASSGFTALAATPSEKVVKMADRFKASGCYQNGRLFEENFHMSFAHSREFKGGGNCPISLLQNRTFEKDRGVWTISDHMNTYHEFHNEVLVQSVSVTGFMSVIGNASLNQTKIRGLIDFKNFKVRDVGLIQVRIETDQAYAGANGNGTIFMTVAARNGMRAEVSVTWNRTKVFYRINNREVDRMTIDELFSSYGLKEMMDRSTKMR